MLTMQVRPMRTISVSTRSTSCTVCKVLDNTTQSNSSVAKAPRPWFKSAWMISRPVLVENTGGAMRLVLHGGWRLGRGTELVEESPHHLAINSQVVGQQESIMA